MGDRLGIQVAVDILRRNPARTAENFRSIRNRPFLNILTSGLHETLPLNVLQAFQVPNACPKREPKFFFFFTSPNDTPVLNTAYAATVKSTSGGASII